MPTPAVKKSSTNDGVQCPDGVVCDIHHVYKMRCIVYDCPPGKNFFPCHVNYCDYFIMHNVNCLTLSCYQVSTTTPSPSSTTQPTPNHLSSGSLALGCIAITGLCVFLSVVLHHRDNIKDGVCPPINNPPEQAIEALHFFNAQEEENILDRSRELNFDRSRLRLMDCEQHQSQELVAI